MSIAYRAGEPGLPGWDRLRHGGLLLDGARLAALARFVPDPLDEPTGRQLRQRASGVLDGGGSGSGNGSGDAPSFVAFVLEQVCGLDASTGEWSRGSRVAPSWGRRAITGETVKPCHLWQGPRGARLPVFLDDGKRLGIGRSRRIVSQVVGWLRAGNDSLALVTNGRQWRLLFAGLDYDAWCEWDLDLWFEEGELSPQVTALRTLLRAELWTPETEDGAPPLLQAIRDTRKGQAELSEVLGERVREAVEILIQGHGEALKERCASVDPADVYRAACRVAMRLVVILFAESRDLLPRDNALYHESYGLNGLLERLERETAHGGALAESHGAWPRVLALFKLVWEGSHHPDLAVAAYGGELFAPGREGADGLSQALRVYESACFEGEALPDRDVHRMLTLMTRTTVRIRQGRGGARAVVPVDFSDLSSEYIGILYEGLLDYELKTAPPRDPVIFLAVGHQPALPLLRLEAMDDRALRTLFEDLEDGPAAAGDAAGDESVEEDGSATDGLAIPAGADERRQSRTRAEAWARRAAQVAGLARKPRGKDTPERRLAFERELGARARQLVGRVILPGEWYLVRWGGTRKGSGSFYTRPGLAVPTVQRTLRPLAYDPPPGADGTPDPNAPPARWTPKRPEQILRAAVCDPACGSGTFPLAALRFLTDALYAALRHRRRIEPDGERALVRLLGIRGGDSEEGGGGAGGSAGTGGGEGDEGGSDGVGTEPVASERRPGGSDGSAGGVGGAGREHVEDARFGDELIPCPPDDDRFEPRLKAVLRRHVVERCIYAVDLDPLAVELCRLSLWIETMDRTLPFGFLDHKVKCGNALIGAWFDQFRHYPAMAWKNREGGDGSHSNGVHFQKNARTRALKAFVKDKLTPDLELFLRGRDLFQADLLEDAATAHDEALAVLAKMHAMPVQDAAERARIYREDLLGSPAWRSLKRAMDLWCACWFWPADEIERAPLPTTFAAPPDATRTVAERVATGMRFFHWELEFPDVFREPGAGFDAVLGNPPWDIAKPVSKEFFSNLDPLYRSYGKQEALRRQYGYFEEDAATERDWLDYNARFRAQSNFVRHAASPYGDPDENTKSQDRFSVARGRQNAELHERWRRARRRSVGFGDPAHPFRHQGAADLNVYKLFLEAVHALLKRPPSHTSASARGQGEFLEAAHALPKRPRTEPEGAGTDGATRNGGRLGFLIPSGLYSDHGTGALRNLFLERCRWEWLFGIENRDRIFPIHRSYKFNPVIVEKGGATSAIRTAFMRRKPEDWEHAEALATPYTKAQVERFSPRSHAILEIQSTRDLEILEKVYARSVLLGDDGPDGWGIRDTREFDMTNDSHLFPPRPQWEAKGYRPDEYSRWLLGDWRPIEELREELGVDPAQPEPAEIELESWLFDTTAGPERREAEACFVHGHLLKPGDVARTDWRVRCAQPPCDGLPIPRAKIPAGVILSREGDAWIREGEIEDVALPVYQGIMIQPFVPSARGWISGTGRRAKWDYNELGSLRWNPQYLMGRDVLDQESRTPPLAKIGYHEVTHSTNARSFIGAVLPSFPCGHKAPVLHIAGDPVAGVASAAALLNSFVFDWLVRQRLGATALAWYVLSEAALPRASTVPSPLLPIVKKLNLFPGLFAAIQVAAGAPDAHAALTPAERVRLRSIMDAISCATYGCNTADLRHILRDSDLPVSDVTAGSRRTAPLDARGFWRVDRDKDPELRHTVLTLVAFHDLESRVRAADGDRAKGIEAFLAQNHGEGWMLPETLRLADYGLGHDERADRPQPVASRLGPRFYDWQLVQSADESWRECHLHARNLLGMHGYALLLVELIERRAAAGEDCLDLLADRCTRDLLGEGRYVTVLFEVRARNALDDDAYWKTVDDLRAGGHLGEDAYGTLLDRLYARKLLDDLGYRRRRGGNLPLAPVPDDKPLLRVADPEADYGAKSPPTGGQTDMFDTDE